MFPPSNYPRIGEDISKLNDLIFRGKFTEAYQIISKYLWLDKTTPEGQQIAFFEAFHGIHYGFLSAEILQDSKSTEILANARSRINSCFPSLCSKSLAARLKDPKDLFTREQLVIGEYVRLAVSFNLTLFIYNSPERLITDTDTLDPSLDGSKKHYARSLAYFGLSIYFKNKNSPEEAKDALKNAEISLDEALAKELSPLLYHSHKALIHAARKDNIPAIQEVTEAIKLNDKDIMLYHQRASLRLRTQPSPARDNAILSDFLAMCNLVIEHCVDRDLILADECLFVLACKTLWEPLRASFSSIEISETNILQLFWPPQAEDAEASFIPLLKQIRDDITQYLGSATDSTPAAAKASSRVPGAHFQPSKTLEKNLPADSDTAIVMRTTFGS